MQRVLLLGAGGHARAVVDAIRAQARYEIAGIVDSRAPIGSTKFGYPVLGNEADVPVLWSSLLVDCAFIAVGDNFQREALAARLRSRIPAMRLAICIHPQSSIGIDTRIGEGTVVMPGTVVVSGSVIGEGCVLNTRSSLDHDGEMGPWSSLGPGVTTGGRVKVGARTFVGLGANLIQGVAIGRDSIIGAGSLVLDDIPDLVVAHGVPARVRHSRRADESYL